VNGALRALGDGWVEGEVRSLKVHGPSGHVYLTLADEGANLDACIWRGRRSRCEPLPRQGDLVQAHYERIDFYAPHGTTKLIVDAVRPTGEGELLRRRAEILARLHADGLCDPQRRRPLRAFPRRVGVVAAEGSDAVVDVVRQLRERLPPQDIVVAPAAVQGVRAVGSIIDALGALGAVPAVDVIVLARGGGSVADLVAFDDERLCRAIFACAAPVITSIGHTKDRPNCDHVAAAFAPVPAKAAELAIRRSAAELLEELDRHRAALAEVAQAARHRGRAVADLWGQARPRGRVGELTENVEAAGELLGSRARGLYGRRDLALTEAARGLDGVSAGLRRPRALDVLAAHLEHARLRLAATGRDHGRALDRLGGDAVREVRRRLGAGNRTVEAEAEHLGPATTRALARKVERVGHLGALVEARDLRRRGWVLAADERGRAVASAGQLSAGRRLELRFADGEAAATVDHVTPSEERSRDG
jgi:exodeoxyribonuclease VII large subunit